MIIIIFREIFEYFIKNERKNILVGVKIKPLHDRKGFYNGFLNICFISF